MKLIHAADLHLASPLSYLPADKRKQKNIQLSNNFKKLIEYAENNSIHHILLSGDIFDNNRPTMQIKTFFYDLIKEHSDITFYYLKGNHDIEASLNEELENLKVFKDSWTSYEIDNVMISGIEIGENIEDYIYNSLILNQNKFNIVMMHGPVSTSFSSDKSKIVLPKLKEKNVDYLALGHIHKYSSFKIDERAVAIYPGCLEGRGFDELGEKGFIVIDTDTKEYKFTKITNRTVEEIEIDLSNTFSENGAIDLIETSLCASQDKILRLVLKGKVDYPCDNLIGRLMEIYKDKFFYFEVKNSLLKKIDIEQFKQGISLRSEFFKIVEADNKLDEKDKEEILNLAANLFLGTEID